MENVFKLCPKLDKKNETKNLFNAGVLCVTVADFKLRTAVELRNISPLRADRNCTSIHPIPPFPFYFLPPPRNCPVNAVVFILLTPPRTARRRPLLNLSARTGACGLRGSEGLQSPRAEVNEGGQKSSEGEVRVHGRVKETRVRLLFTPHPLHPHLPLHAPAQTNTDAHLCFLPTRGCVPCATVLTPLQPRRLRRLLRRAHPVCFSAFIKSSPGRKTSQNHHVTQAPVSLALYIPPRLLEEPFVWSLPVKSGGYF